LMKFSNKNLYPNFFMIFSNIIFIIILIFPVTFI
jgi:hypothetical protein